MRKFILFIFIICASNFLKAQVWCPPGAEWYFTRTYCCGSSYVKHTFTNTVTINSVTCQQLLYFNQYYTYLGNSVGSYTANVFTYVNNNVVYLYDGVNNNFDTLFNYNATIGSKWGLPNKSTTNCYKSRVLVTDTGHKLIQGLNLKWLKVSVSRYTYNSIPSSFTDTIYERIGCLDNYFYNQNDVCYPISDAEKGGPLRCYGDNQLSNYKRYSNACNYFYNPTSLIEYKNTDSFKIYPNPANDILNITLNNDNFTFKMENVHYSIINNLGQIIKEEEIIFNNNRATIKTAELKAGIYFIKIVGNGNLVTTKKIIKQ